MIHTLRRCLALASSLAVLVATAGSPVLAVPGDARLEGLVTGIDGRPAAGHGVLLIDDRGRVQDRALTSDEGLYSFPGVAAGSYGLGLEMPDGTAAPVMAAPTRIRPSRLVRRDIKLVIAPADTVLAPAQSQGDEAGDNAGSDAPDEAQGDPEGKDEDDAEAPEKVRPEDLEVSPVVLWWVGLPTAAKAGIIAGGVIVIGLIVNELTSSDDRETPASPSVP